jgi:myo-inositol catabolism protein IolC
VIKSIGIAEGLGSTSAYTWMKLPVVAEMERVMAATTMPTVLLGGDPDSSQDDVFASWEAALALPGVQGLTVGRTLLYPHGRRRRRRRRHRSVAAELRSTTPPAPQKYRSNVPWE